MCSQKELIINKAKRRIEFNYDTLDENQVELLSDFYDSAINAIKKWRHLTDNKEFENDDYNDIIVKYIVRTYQELGLEGVTSSTIGGDTKTFGRTPLAELLSSIPQRI